MGVVYLLGVGVVDAAVVLDNDAVDVGCDVVVDVDDVFEFMSWSFSSIVRPLSASLLSSCPSASLSSSSSTAALLSLSLSLVSSFAVIDGLAIGADLAAFLVELVALVAGAGAAFPADFLTMTEY